MVEVKKGTFIENLVTDPDNLKRFLVVLVHDCGGNIATFLSDHSTLLQTSNADEVCSNNDSSNIELLLSAQSSQIRM